MKREPIVGGPIVVVQTIAVEWTKASRGGAGARLRNAVPEAEVVDDALFRAAAGRGLMAQSDWGEANAFAATLRTRGAPFKLSPPFRWAGVVVTMNGDGGLTVEYDGAHPAAGVPDRWFLRSWSNPDGTRGPAMSLAPGEWGRVCWNLRRSDRDGDWRYERFTVNVARCDGPVSPNLFLDRRPTRELRLLASLW